MPKFSLLNFLIFFTTVAVLLGLLVRSEMGRRKLAQEFDRRLTVERRIARDILFENGCQRIVSAWQRSLVLSDSIMVTPGPPTAECNSNEFVWEYFVDVFGEYRIDLANLKQSLDQSVATYSSQPSRDLKRIGVFGDFKTNLVVNPRQPNDQSQYILRIEFVVD